MKKSIILSLIAAALIIGFLGCENPTNGNGDDDIPEPVENPLWPFEVGNSWTLEVRDDQAGAEDTLFYEEYRVEDVFGHDGERVAELNFRKFIGDSTLGSYTFWWGNTESGLYQFANLGDEFEPYEEGPILLFKKPAEEGENFASFILMDGEAPDDVYFFSSGIPTISVPAGDFESCLGYQVHRDPGMDIYYYFTPDTGYVRMEKYVGGSLVKTRSLTELQLN